MPSRYAPTDRRFLRDLWHATKPAQDEHRLAFTVKLTTFGSTSLRNKGSGFLTAALKLVRDSLALENPKDIVVTVERNKKATQTSNGPTVNIHIHGWALFSDSISASAIQNRMNARASHKKNKKICRGRGWHFTGINSRTGNAIDIGWPNYIDKDFNRWPTNCIAATHRFSATGHTKTLARAQGLKRRDNLRKIQRYFRKIDRQIQRKEGEWKYWHLAYDPYDP